MHTITKTVYKFSELEGNAKEKAADWLREGATDYDWWDTTYEDAIEVGKLMGLEINTRYRGKNTADLWFSGFSSQGDGCCWGGAIDWKLFNGAEKRVKDYAPVDKELHRIAKQCQSAYDEAIKAIRQIATQGEVDNAIEWFKDYYPDFSVTSNDRSKSQRVESGSFEIDEEVFDNEFDDKEFEGAAQEIADDFASWIYKQLETEYEYRTSDEAIAENAEANEYTFDVYGNREG